MNGKIQRMMQEIERRGGKVHILDTMPDDMAEQFLHEVLTCPDCCASTFDDRLPIDQLLAGTGRKSSDH